MKTDRLTDPVRLKPLFGIEPARWVPLAYLALLVVLLFALLVLPGTLKHGTLLTIESLPPGAAVEIDGIYVGAAPVEHFTLSGDRRIVVSAPGYSSDAILVNVPGRLVGSLFLPRRETISIGLQAGEPDAIIAAAFDEFTSWSYIGSSSAQYQFPPVLASALEGLTSVGASVSSSDLLLRGSLDVTSDVLAKDLVAAAFTADKGGGIATGASLANTATAVAQLLATSPRIHRLAEAITDGGVYERVAGTDWYADRTAETTTAVLPYTREGDVDYSGGGRVVSVGGMSFYELPATVMAMGETRERQTDALFLQPHPVRIEGVFVGQTEVTRGQYLAFVNENPQWALTSKEALLQSGLVSRDYLNDWVDLPPSSGDRLPVVNVSAYAAEAFAEWVTARLPESLSGYRARLPYESEWEWAAEYAAADNYPAVFLENGRDGPAPVASIQESPVPIYDLAGNVWEWNANGFHRASYLVEPPQHAATPRIEPVTRFAHRSVRGGSWANLPGTVSTISRASQPLWWCTPYLGFRLVLVRE